MVFAIKEGTLILVKIIVILVNPTSHFFYRNMMLNLIRAIFRQSFFLSLLVFAVFSSLATSCSITDAEEPEKRDTGITVVNAYSSIFFDSLNLEQYFVEQKVADTLKKMIRDFYNVRNFQYAWFDKNGLSEQAIHFRSLLHNYLLTNDDSGLRNPTIEALWDSVEANNNHLQLSEEEKTNFEFELTRLFYDYAFKAYIGNNAIDPGALKWFIPRKKVSVTTMLDSLVANKGQNISNYEPVNSQYKLLNDVLKKLYQIKQQGGWGRTEFTQKKYVPGDDYPEIAWIRNRLFLSGDLALNDSSTVYDSLLLDGVKNFQLRHGLAPDGVIGVGTIAFLNQSVDDIIRKVMINIERQRWVPSEPQTDFLLVNIPEFMLHLYEDGKHVYKMSVVVGSTQHNTVIFTDELKYVVFSPYWNVPPSIYKNEILPGIAKDPNYLARHNMEYYGNGVRQKPGPSNSLGLVKFLFPNNYNIYLHDTPSKSLFNESSRAFSHGCIRVSEPLKLAEWILRKDTTWNRDKIVEAMNAGKEKYVEVKEKIPVIIGYFTAWVDAEGRLQLRKDIYGHDEALAAKLFLK